MMARSAIVTAGNAEVDVLVFPEFGIGADLKSRAAMAPYCELVPTATNQSLGVILGTLRSILRNVSASKVPHVSVNFCERDESDRFWNTNVVLDPMGQIVAKYRKTHPYFTNIFDTPPTPDYVIFNASFTNPPRNVTFGIFTCKDILFPEPATGLVERGARLFLYSVDIEFSFVPHLLFGGWARHYESTLIASNLGGYGLGVYTSHGSDVSQALPIPDTNETIRWADLPLA
eukprot:c32864_g1_i1.p1 GENE.c32864_g1_i1~~c32864_g1_i1.p1  ORF type:complete len:268 (-),score=39.42 c32864_g1_i1:8-700(-)